VEIGRRQFLKLCSALVGEAALLSLSSCTTADRVVSKAQGNKLLPKQTLGKTACRISIIGLGGVVVSGVEQEHADRVVAESIEKGVNYFDVAPSYGDAELKFGPALKPYRDKIFLACKTLRRDRAGAQKELNDSLRRLQTDHIDLYQFHALTNIEKDLNVLLGRGGAMETFLQARRQGIIRYIGFTAHSKETSLAAMREFDFDTIMFPVNFVCHYRADFVAEVLSEAKKRNMGIIAIKSMAKQPWSKGVGRKMYPKCWYQPVDEPQLAKAALGFSFAQGATAILPPGDEGLYRLALDLAGDSMQIAPEQLRLLEERAAGLNPIFTG